MTLKEEFIDMLSLINPNITEDSYEEDYVIEEDCFMEVCKKTGKEITYSNECSECEYCLDDCNCEYKLCKKVDIYLWSGAEDSRGYIFKKDSDALNASSVHYINNQKQLVKEMAILKKEFDSFRDGYAAYAKRIQEYKKYIAEFVDEVTSEFSVFENVNKDIIPVVFDEDCRRDHDWEKETFIGGDFHNVGVQSVIHIYDSWSRDMEHMKQTIRHSANEFREFDDVLDETAAKWEKLSSVQRAAVSKAFAGTRQANRFQLLMENYDKALEYEKIANNSQGTAMKKFEENYLNSLEAKQKSLQASFESLSMNIISRESYSGIIEATQALVEFLNQTNLLKGAISGLAIGGLTKGFLSITTGLTKSAMHMQNFQKSFELLKSGNIDADGIEKLISYTDGLSKSQLKAILSSEQLTTAQRIQILTATGMDEATAKATLATMGLSAANTTATGTTLSLGTALKGLWNTLLSNPIMIVGMAVTAGVSMWQSYKQSIKEAVSSAKSAGQSFQENTSSLNSNISKVKELKSALASGTLSEQESAQAKSQLLEIQNQLVSTYGEQKAKIDLVNGSLEKELSLMNDLAVQDANKYLNENKKGIDKASDEMEKNRKT